MINVMVIRKKSEARLLQSNFMRLFLDHILVCTPAPLPPPPPPPPPPPALCSDLPSASKYINSILSV